MSRIKGVLRKGVVRFGRHEVNVPLLVIVILALAALVIFDAPEKPSADPSPMIILFR